MTMQTDRAKTAGEVFCEVIESLAFMFGEPSRKEDLPPAGSSYVQATMTFAGPFKGSLALVVPEEVAPEIAANILGVEVDDEMAREQAEDTLKEVLNVTCGHILTALAGEEPVFNLSVPEIAVTETAAWQAFLNNPDTAVFMVDDSPMLLLLSIDDRVQA